MTVKVCAACREPEVYRPGNVCLTCQGNLSLRRIRELEAQLATARAEAREEALEDAAKVCDESIRILASRPVAVFDNYREYLKALVKRPAAPTCARCGGNGIDPEHIGACGECGGRVA